MAAAAGRVAVPLAGAPAAARAAETAKLVALFARAKSARDLCDPDFMPELTRLLDAGVADVNARVRYYMTPLLMVRAQRAAPPPTRAH
jgi:hypothetical protein